MNLIPLFLIIFIIVGEVGWGRNPRLVKEKSLYLRQHADNPVDWYPWGPEAFETARREDKPIFLSIGYAACHWCHVMEKESFMDPEVAQRLNAVFVPVLVDREERPDVDHIYMTVCQILGSSCGWPLNVLLMPDGRPFFATTYLPKRGRFQRIGLLDLIDRVEALWRKKRQELNQAAAELTAALRALSSLSPGQDPGPPALHNAWRTLVRHFDSVYGGFGDGPKFPLPHRLSFLLRYWKRTGETQARKMVETTLQAIRRGGIYDHVGFGLHRYATDAAWRIPHFEKMLYDQALLAYAYLEAYQVTGQNLYAETAREIFTYVLRDLRSPEGPFYSAEDADSGGEEGAFYIWTVQELRQVLTSDEYKWLTSVFSIRPDGHSTDPVRDSSTGKNILFMTVSLDVWVSNRDRWEAVRRKLFNARLKRPRPLKDDKILVDWNGLMIAALAYGGRVLDEPTYARAARQAADFILRHMRTPDGRLWHRYRDGEAAIPGYLTDYAFFVWGLIELYETTFQVKYLREALRLTDTMLARFWDFKHGGLYLSDLDADTPLLRPKEVHDGAIPSGNSVAAWNLLRLGRITARSEYQEKAHQILRVFSQQIARYPAAYTQMLIALDFALGPTYEIVIAGDPRRSDTKAMVRALARRWLPNAVVILRPTDQPNPPIVRLAPYTRTQRAIEGKATAYVCSNYVCEKPTTDIRTMLRLLSSSSQK